MSYLEEDTKEDELSTLDRNTAEKVKLVYGLRTDRLTYTRKIEGSEDRMDTRSFTKSGIAKQGSRSEHVDEEAAHYKFETAIIQCYQKPEIDIEKVLVDMQPAI